MVADSNGSSSLLDRDSSVSIGSGLLNRIEYESTSMRSFTRKMMKSLSSEERRHALREKGVGRAAFLIRDAVLGFQDAPYEGFYDPYATLNSDVAEINLRNTISFVCGRLIASGWLTRILLLANWLLFLLSFIEPPHWCRDSDLVLVQNNTVDAGYGDCDVLLSAKGMTADGEENQALYPNFGIMLITISQSQCIELVCIFIIFLMMLSH